MILILTLRWIPKTNNSKKSNKKNNKRKSGARKTKTVAVPVAIGYQTKGNMPSFKKTPTGVCIRRREFVRTVTNGTTTGFSFYPLSVQTPGLDLNPGSSGLFPWCSNIAQSFERFRFNSVKVELIPSQATTSAGRVYMAIDYDYDDPPPSTKQQMMNNLSSVESNVWQKLTLNAVTSQLNKDTPFKYVSTFTRNNFVEPRTAYSGFLIIAFDTAVTNCTFDLYVEYDVNLDSPVMEGTSVQDNLVKSTSLAGAVTATTAAFGAGNAAQLNEFSTATGPIKVITPGDLGAPMIWSHVLGAALPMSKAFDCGALSPTSNVTLNAAGQVTAATPVTTLATDELAMIVDAHDSAGNYLGQVATGNTSAGTFADTANQLGTNAGWWQLARSVLWSQVLATYPTARYLTHVLTSANAVGAGTAAGGFKVEY